ncbi:MAG: hypothetical protein ILP19_04810 [Oscillospiraceae bacterium]|nr:hypothetical protein [Oscillospiraceae bacterium]
MNSTSRLFRTGYRDIYTTDRDALFASAMRENVSFHYEHCEGYRRILDDAGFMPDRIKSVDDLADLPFLTTLYLKRHILRSRDENKLVIKATSSGTS